MNICHVISYIDKNSGGTSSYEQTTLNELVKYIPVSLITVKSSNPIKINEKVNLFSAQKSFPFFQAYSKELKFLVNQVGCDLFHGNGLWQYPVHKMCKIAFKKNRPYIISPHGMLRPWALNQSKLKKQIAFKLYQKKDLDNAACLHATSQIEAQEMRELGFRNPIAVVPNGIDLSEYQIRSEKYQSLKTILYLSRIHPKKGLEELIEAWSAIDKSIRHNWKIKIAGNGDEKYINELKALVTDKKLENEILFIGPKFANDKIATFQNADIFVLPTHGEGFPMAVLEAMVCNLPVITTKGAPWQELQTYNAGWWIDIGAAPLAQALTEAMELSDDERMTMGLNGRKIVEENYSIEIVAKKMIQLYEWILYKTEKPEFVI